MRNGYRLRYETLRAALTQADAARDAEALDRAQEELDAFVAGIATDARKLRAVAADSPACAEEISAHAATVGLPRQVLDPMHDSSFTRLWLASLADTQVAMLQRVLVAELDRRDLGGAGRGHSFLRTA